MEDSNNKIENKSKDHDYFVITPEIVLAGTDPYESRFWMTVKMIAGDSGQCYAGIRLLAQLSRMSAGKANQCRKSLVKKGFLQGGPINKGDPNSLWNLTIPNLWKANINWRENAGGSLRDRVRSYLNFWEEKLWERKPKKTRTKLPF